MQVETPRTESESPERHLFRLTKHVHRGGGSALADAVRLAQRPSPSLESLGVTESGNTQLGQELVRAQIGQDRRHLLILAPTSRSPEDGAGSVKPYAPEPPTRCRTAASTSPSRMRGVRTRIMLPVGIYLSLVAQPPRSHAGECLALPPPSLVLASQRRVLSRKSSWTKGARAGRAALHPPPSQNPTLPLLWPPCCKTM